MNPTSVSAKGISFLVDAEGFRTKPYKDSKDNWTIGVGHLIKLPQEEYLLKKTLTKAEVVALLHKDLPIYQEAVNQHLKVPVSQNVYDALVACCFNLGESQFSKSSILRAVNNNSGVTALRKAFGNWTDGGLLTKRRAIESRLATEGVYSDAISLADTKKYLNRA